MNDEISIRDELNPHEKGLERKFLNLSLVLALWKAFFGL